MKVDQNIALEGVNQTVVLASVSENKLAPHVAINLAFSLLHQGRRVAMLDLDFFSSNLAQMLCAEPLLAHLQEPSDKIQPHLCRGVKFISPFCFLRDQRVPMSKEAILSFLQRVDWGVVDVLLIYLPIGFADDSLSALSFLNIDGALIISSPRCAIEGETKALVKVMHDRDISVLGVVENMSYFIEPISSYVYYPSGKGLSEMEAKNEGVAFLGELPIGDELLFDVGLSPRSSMPFGSSWSCYEPICLALLSSRECMLGL